MKYKKYSFDINISAKINNPSFKIYPSGCFDEVWDRCGWFQDNNRFLKNWSGFFSNILQRGMTSGAPKRLEKRVECTLKICRCSHLVECTLKTLSIQFSLGFPSHATMPHKLFMHAIHKLQYTCVTLQHAMSPHHLFMHVSHRLFFALVLILRSLVEV